MKCALFFVCVVIGMSEALTVDEAYEAYQKSTTKVLEPGGDVKSLAKFKEDWNEAQKFLNQYKTTEEAWKGYKEKFKAFNKTTDDDDERFKLFKPKWEEMVKHNEKYARGEIYYPHWPEPFMHYSEAELEELRSRPVH